MIINCLEFKSFQRNTLLGFATIRIEDIHLIIKDVAIHTKNGATWAQLPSKPQIKDGALVKDNTGKIQYWPVMEFADREARDAFSREAIRAVNAFHPGAIAAPQKFERSAPPARVPGDRPTQIDLDDAVPF